MIGRNTINIPEIFQDTVHGLVGLTLSILSPYKGEYNKTH